MHIPRFAAVCCGVLIAGHAWFLLAGAGWVGPPPNGWITPMHWCALAVGIILLWCLRRIVSDAMETVQNHKRVGKIYERIARLHRKTGKIWESVDEERKATIALLLELIAEDDLMSSPKPPEDLPN